jgi:hypothetical protein
MADLREKAAYRTVGSRKPMKLIIGDTESVGTHVKATTIKLDPKVKGRGTGTVGATITGRSFSTSTTGSVTSGMGGRH